MNPLNNVINRMSVTNKQGERIMNRTKNALLILSALAVVALMGLATSAKAGVVFQDDFNNGVVTDSDTVPGFWTANPNNLGTANNTFAEANSELSISITGGSGSSGGNMRPLASVASAVGNDFNFFNQPLTFSGGGLSFSGTAAGFNQLGNFDVISGDGIEYYTSTSGVQLRIGANNKVSLQVKTGFPNNGGTTLVNSVSVGAPVTGFDLALDATHYNLTIYTTSGAFDSSNNPLFAGVHGLTAAGWGSGGQSALALVAQRVSTTTTETAIFNVGSLDVTSSIPEPASLALLGVGGLMMVIKRRR